MAINPRSEQKHYKTMNMKNMITGLSEDIVAA